MRGRTGMAGAMKGTATSGTVVPASGSSDAATQEQSNAPASIYPCWRLDRRATWRCPGSTGVNFFAGAEPPGSSCVNDDRLSGFCSRSHLQ